MSELQLYDNVRDGKEIWQPLLLMVRMELCFLLLMLFHRPKWEYTKDQTLSYYNDYKAKVFFSIAYEVASISLSERHNGVASVNGAQVM